MTKKDVNKRKILYIITKSNFGGAQKYVFDLSTNLSKNTFDSVVVSGGEGILNEKLKKAGIKTIKIKQLQRDVSILNDIIVFFNLLEIIKKERPDVIHLNSSKIGGLGALAGRIYNLINHKTKVLIVFTAHGWAFNEPRSYLQKTIIKLVSWVTVLLSHKTITVSEFDYRQGILMPFTRNKILVVHNGISKTTLIKKNLAREILLKNTNTETNNKTILIGTISELHKNKGLKYAIKALKNLPEKFTKVIFVIIGEGEKRKSLENLIKKERLGKKVLLLGYKDNASSLLKAFDIFILPSIKEGLPYVLLEAGMAKLPVISTDTGGIPEIIDDMKSGILVRSKSPTEITESITYMLSNKTKMKEFGQELYGKVKKEFSTEKMLKETMQIYKS